MDLIDVFMLFGFVMGCWGCVCWAVVLHKNQKARAAFWAFVIASLCNFGFAVDLAITFFVYAE